jgi:hypothetical protein
MAPYPALIFQLNFADVWGGSQLIIRRCRHPLVPHRVDVGAAAFVRLSRGFSRHDEFYECAAKSPLANAIIVTFMFSYAASRGQRENTLLNCARWSGSHRPTWAHHIVVGLGRSCRRSSRAELRSHGLRFYIAAVDCQLSVECRHALDCCFC